MKFCFVSYNAYSLFYPELKKFSGGGSEVQLYNIAIKIAETKEHEITFIVKNSGQENKNFRHIRITKTGRQSLKNGMLDKLYNGISLIFNIYKIKADIYIQRAAGWETFILALFCKCFRKEFVYMSAHEIDTSGEFVNKSGLLGRFYKWGLKNASLVISQNLNQKKNLKERYNIDSPIIKSGYIIPDLPQEKQREYILWVARIVRWKNPDIFIKIAKRFPQQKFVMIGPKDKNNLKYFRKIRYKTKDVKNINFIEGVPFNEINKYFKDAKIFINTSKYEGFPNTFIQSAMHGVPILSLNVNPNNIFNKYEFGFCVQNDFEKLLNYLNRFIADEKFYSIYSKNAYEYAKKEHDIKDIVFQLIKNIKKKMYDK